MKYFLIFNKVDLAKNEQELNKAKLKIEGEIIKDKRRVEKIYYISVLKQNQFDWFTLMNDITNL